MYGLLKVVTMSCQIPAPISRDATTYVDVTLEKKNYNFISYYAPPLIGGALGNDAV